MRLAITALAALALAAPALAQDEVAASEGPIYEPVTYRFGGTYRIEKAADATACATLCGGDRHCRAWSFVVLGGDRRCELKSTVGQSQLDPAATSGISPAHEAIYAATPVEVETVAAEPEPEDVVPTDVLIGAAPVVRVEGGQKVQPVAWTPPDETKEDAQVPAASTLKAAVNVLRGAYE